MNRNQAGAAPVAVEKPALVNSVDGIEKTLLEALAQLSRVNAGIDRLRMEPQDASEGQSVSGTRAVQTLETRLQDVQLLSGQLAMHLAQAAERLDGAV